MSENLSDRIRSAVKDGSMWTEPSTVTDWADDVARLEAENESLRKQIEGGLSQYRTLEDEVQRLRVEADEWKRRSHSWEAMVRAVRSAPND